MTDEEYKELNELMLNLVAYSEKYDPFLYRNIDFLRSVVSTFYSKTDQDLYPAGGSFSPFPIEKSLELVREFLTFVNPEYLQIFEKDLESGLIEFYSKSENKGNHFFADLETGEVKVIVTLNENVKDGESIIHEFFHKLNYIGTNETRHVFTEAISIYFEFLYHNFLYAKDIPVSEVQLCQKWRHDIMLDNANSFSFQGTLFKKKKNNIDINRNTYKEFNANSKDFDEDCKFTLLDGREEDIRMLDYYRHIYGTLLASYLYQNSKNIKGTLKQLIYINDNINQMGMDEVLDYLNFPNDDNFVESLVDAYKNKREDDLYMAEEQVIL